MAASFQPLLHSTQSLVVTLNTMSNGSHLITHRNGQPPCFLQVHDERRQLDQEWVPLTVSKITEFKLFHVIKLLVLSVEQCLVPWKKWFPQLVQIASVDICSVNIEEVVHELGRIHPVTISPFWPCFWPSSFFFSHQVHVLLKVTLQEDNKNNA
jgi:hypothetical protein